MHRIISGLLVVAGVIHLLPLSGVLGPERLSALYGIAFHEPNLLILMQHRAVLFGLLGALLIYAAVRPAIQPLAFAGGLISTVSFIVLAYVVGFYNSALARNLIVDIVAVACLAVAVGLWAFKRPNG